MKFSPSFMVEVKDIAALHPDVFADRGQAVQGILIRLAARHGVSLTDGADADRPDKQEAADSGTLQAVSGAKEVGIRCVDLNANVQVSVVLVKDSEHRTRDANTGRLDRQPIRVVHEPILICGLASTNGRAVATAAGVAVPIALDWADDAEDDDEGEAALG